MAYSYNFLKKEVKSKPKHLKCKREWSSTKKALLERIWNQNGRPRLPAFDDSLNVLIMMTSLYNIVILGARAPDVDGIKIFDKDEQAAKHCSLS